MLFFGLIHEFGNAWYECLKLAGRFIKVEVEIRKGEP